MTINVQAPDGSSITFPEGTPRDTIISVMQKNFGGGESEQGSSLAGAGKALVSGAVGGVADLAGLPADVLALTGAQGTKEFQDKYGSQAIRQGVTNQTGYDFYKPQGFAERALETTGNFLPGMIGGGGSLVGKFLTRAAIPALAAETAGELTDQNPYVKTATALGAAALTPALGAGARNLAAKAITPNPISAERQAALSVLKQEGVELPAGMVTGSRFVKAAESELGGAKYADMVENAQRQYTTAAINRLSPSAGVKGEGAWTPQVIAKAEDNVGKVFDDIAARNPSIPLDKVGVNALQKVADDFELLTGNRSKLIDTFVQRVGATGAAPNISGQSYQALSSEISRYSRAANDPSLKIALGDLKAALDSTIQRGLPNSADLAAWKEARRDWHNILLLNKTVSGSPEAAAMGLITPAKLTQAIDGMKRGNYARGKGDFAELARAGNAVMKSFPDSGTSTRLRSAAIPAAMGAILGGGIGAIPGAAVGLAGPYIGGKALMSGPVQRYLTNQRMAAPTPAGGALGLPSPAQASVYAQLMNMRTQPVE